MDVLIQWVFPPSLVELGKPSNLHYRICDRDPHETGELQPLRVWPGEAGRDEEGILLPFFPVCDVLAPVRLEAK